MRPSTTARRYAEAAFDVARDDNDVEGWLADLRAAAEALGEPSAASYFKDPKASSEDKIATLRQLLPNVRPHVLNLLLTLVSRHRIGLLPGIVTEFETLEHAARGIVEAYVTVARAISEKDARELGARLGQVEGGRQVNLHTHIDPAILGGIVVRIGDRLFDWSVRGRLERLRQEIAV